MPKITEIIRSFSKTIQEEAYSPISLFASYKGELDGTETPEQIKQFSNRLYFLAEKDVREEQARIENAKIQEEHLGGEPPFKNDNEELF
jgi:hypothetical protein